MTLTVHALLHIADTIERIGPVWAWWLFPVERQCGRLQQHITNRQHPFINLDNYLTLAAQLKTTIMIYNIGKEELSLKKPIKKRPALELYGECMFGTHHRARGRSNYICFQTKGSSFTAKSTVAVASLPCLTHGPELSSPVCTLGMV